mgnify:CR=1 FL=1
MDDDKLPNEEESLTGSKSPSRSEVGQSAQRLFEGAITVGVCIAYTMVGPLLIMLNKLILTRHFPYPILLTSFHQLSSALISAFLVRGLKLVPLQHEMTWHFWSRNVLVVGFATMAALCTGTEPHASAPPLQPPSPSHAISPTASAPSPPRPPHQALPLLYRAPGNSSYMYLTVAFIEILKGFTPVVTMMVQV